VAAIEVGLGGRLDATNVITPMAAAITSIDFDHEALLGSTLAAIAGEKAGVVKPGIPVVIGPLPREAEDAVARVCSERGAELIRARDRVRVSAESAAPDALVTIESPAMRLAHVRPALAGRHQRDNAAVAVAVLQALRRAGMRVSPEHIRAGLEHAVWPGRLERTRWQGADVLLDAAHNAAGARALAAHLRDSGWTSITLLIGVMHDKDAAAILTALAPFANRIVCTTPPSPRALAAADLAAVARRVAAAPGDVQAMADPAAALAAACRPGARVVACGSIFLIGPLRGILR
jgi:dihydrofolate synthase/folylpolyglutamate synthase